MLEDLPRWRCHKVASKLDGDHFSLIFIPKKASKIQLFYQNFSFFPKMLARPRPKSYNGDLKNQWLHYVSLKLQDYLIFIQAFWKYSVQFPKMEPWCSNLIQKYNNFVTWNLHLYLLKWVYSIKSMMPVTYFHSILSTLHVLNNNIKMLSHNRLILMNFDEV